MPTGNCIPINYNYKNVDKNILIDNVSKKYPLFLINNIYIRVDNNYKFFYIIKKKQKDEYKLISMLDYNKNIMDNIIIKKLNMYNDEELLLEEYEKIIDNNVNDYPENKNIKLICIPNNLLYFYYQSYKKI